MFACAVLVAGGSVAWLLLVILNAKAIFWDLLRKFR